MFVGKKMRGDVKKTTIFQRSDTQSWSIAASSSFFPTWYWIRRNGGLFLVVLIYLLLNELSSIFFFNYAFIQKLFQLNKSSYGQYGSPKFQIQLAEHERELIEMNANSEKLRQSHNELLEFKMVLQKVNFFLDF